MMASLKKTYLVMMISVGVLSASLPSNAFFTYQKCLRFNESKLRIPLSFYSETNLTGDKWVTVDFNIYSWFCASESLASSSSKEVFFTNIEPKEGFNEFNQGQRIYWPESGGQIICQWDIKNYKEIYSDTKINGRLLRTLAAFFDENGHDSQFDTTYYSFTPDESTYCFEFSSDSDVGIAIDITSNFFVNSNNIVEIEQCKNKNNNNTNIKRAYKKDFIPFRKYYIQIYGEGNYDYYSTNHNYSFTIKKVRPIILVHGIGASPTSTNDHDTTFGNIPKEFPIISELPPNIVFDFPWDADNGHYSLYCNNNSTSLFHFVSQMCCNISKKPIMLVHSMGGFLTLTQIEKEHAFLNLIDDLAFFGTPFCGSDDAQHNILGRLLASSENLYSLRRGINHIWNLLDNIPDEFFDEHNSIYFVGTHSRIYKLGSGGISSDGVVKEASANLPGTLLRKNIFVKKVNLNHLNIKSLCLPYSGEYEDIFDEIKTRLF